MCNTVNSLPEDADSSGSESDGDKEEGDSDDEEDDAEILEDDEGEGDLCGLARSCNVQSHSFAQQRLAKMGK